MLSRSWLPQPLLSLVLLITWLLLVNSIAPGHILLGAVFGLLIPLATNPFWPQRPHLRRLGVFLKFIVTVLADIVIANIAVARLILGPPHALRSRFIELPLDLQEEFAITLLASTISLTPGTVSSDVSPDRKRLLIHCLDVDDEAALIAQIKSRYEAPIKEAFEC